MGKPTFWLTPKPPTPEHLDSCTGGGLAGGGLSVVPTASGVQHFPTRSLELQTDGKASAFPTSDGSASDPK